MRARLTRITDNGHTRTTVIDGDAPSIPIIGETFLIFARPLDESKDYREVETSTIKNVVLEGPGTFLFETQNTVYRMEVL